TTPTSTASLVGYRASRLLTGEHASPGREATVSGDCRGVLSQRCNLRGAMALFGSRAMQASFEPSVTHYRHACLSGEDTTRSMRPKYAWDRTHVPLSADA